MKAAKGPQRPDSPPDPNLAILSIADWGNTPNAKSKQPAQLPSKQANAASKCALHAVQVSLTLVASRDLVKLCLIVSHLHHALDVVCTSLPVLSCQIRASLL